MNSDIYNIYDTIEADTLCRRVYKISRYHQVTSLTDDGTAMVETVVVAAQCQDWLPLPFDCQQDA